MSSQEFIHDQNIHPGRFVNALELNRKTSDNPALEWRRLFSEVLGTFLLVLVGAGGGVVNAVSNGQISRAAGIRASDLSLASRCR